MSGYLKKLKLEVELVPRSCFYSNLRSNLSKRDWEYLRQQTIATANYHCEICGSDGGSNSLECHEIWKYDDEELVQSLIGLVALCKACHRSKHMALARHKGWEDAAERHLMRVNQWDRQTLNIYLEDAFQLYEERSNKTWQLDITWLVQYDIVIPEKLDRQPDDN
jgi:hypothetical protein